MGALQILEEMEANAVSPDSRSFEIAMAARRRDMTQRGDDALVSEGSSLGLEQAQTLPPSSNSESQDKRKRTIGGKSRTRGVL